MSHREAGLKRTVIRNTSGKRERILSVARDLDGRLTGFVDAGEDSPKWSPRRETRNTAVLREVRRRDGDHCRFCRRVVNFVDRKSAAAGVYAHAVPSATGAGSLVVACRGCEAARRDGEVLTLVLPPSRPVYSTFTAGWLAEDSDRELVVDHDAERSSVGKGEPEERAVNDSFSSAVRVDRVRVRRRRFPLRIRYAGQSSVAVRDPRGGQFVNRSFDPSGFNEAVHHDRLLDVVLDVVVIPELRINVELVSLVEDGNAHEFSPSVGAPSGAVCDNPNPTDEDPQAGAADPHGRAGTPEGQA